MPVTLLQTNACSPLATNAIRDNIWDNFSSESYKRLPSAGTITVRHPMNGAESPYELPAGGRGYIRPASLVSLWSTSPFLQNNTVGYFDEDPSVDARMSAFSDAISQMLYPELRKKDALVFANQSGAGVGFIDRITVDSWLDVPKNYLPPFLRPLVPLSRALVPSIGGSGSSISIGPFPKDFPIGLITNTDLLGGELPDAQRKAHNKQLLDLVKRAIRELEGEKDFRAVARSLAEDMLALSKCKDFVVNKGHYFGTDYFAEEPGLSSDDKYALIEFLKTF